MRSSDLALRKAGRLAGRFLTPRERLLLIHSFRLGVDLEWQQWLQLSPFANPSANASSLRRTVGRTRRIAAVRDRDCGGRLFDGKRA